MPSSRNPSTNEEQTSEAARSQMPERIGERYHVRALLGRGGMGAVYRVADARGGPDRALKQLLWSGPQHGRAAVEALFEREFQTLVELDHPRVIRVYEYGVAPSGPYYTMELLDGGSLTDCAPIPWRSACSLIHDVCSSLSLLHVRRLVHRDVSPHNVRTTSDGRAKLIDFGAMASMGPSEQVIGTPAFTAPEVVHRLPLDARTDLFSLGATLYFALTGTLAFAARSFSQLDEAWSKRPAPPSAVVADIPAQLDALVMSMLSLEPALRPRSASEVMLQLATLIGGTDEEHAVLCAYLNTPSLVGRAKLLQRFKRRIARARAGRGSSLLIEASAGVGRSRALEACAIVAQTQGCIVVRASGSSVDARPFVVAQKLTEQLAVELPETCLAIARQAQIADLLFEPPDAPAASSPLPPALRTRAFAARDADRIATQDALITLWLQLASTRPLMIAVDDLERVDEPSAAWLATLAVQCRKHQMLLVFSASNTEREHHPARKLIARRSSGHKLLSLSASDTESLLMSAFGDVPHVSLLADRVFRVARGNPGASMELARHLIERSIIRYTGGTWSMPVQLSVQDLPESMDQAFSARAAALSPDARRLGELHALCSYGALSKLDQSVLLKAEETHAERARAELVGVGALVRQDDRFAMLNESWAAALTRQLDGEQTAERHHALGELAERTQRHAFICAYHLFCAGAPAQALDALKPILRNEIDQGAVVAIVTADRAGQVLCWALSHAQTHAGAPRDLADLRRWLCSVSLASDDRFYQLAAPDLLKDLRRDSGLDDWSKLSGQADARERLVAALTCANQRHLALPESVRVYSVQEAIKLLVQHVAVSIAIGTRTLNQAILVTLPELLEPFIALSPVIDAMYENALATRECGLEGRYPQARARWQAVYDRLASVSREHLPYVDAIRSAIVFGLGCLEAARGLPAAADRAVLLDSDPMHRVNAMYLRRVMRLQMGDFDGAEHFRRRAELLAVQLNSRQMFTTLLLVELAAYVTARDLTGVREISERMTELAQHAHGWQIHKAIADGCLKFLRGDLDAARATLEQALTQCWPSDTEPLRALGPLPVVAGVLLEVMLAQQAYADARAFGLRALETCHRADIRTVDEIERGLALAEAKLGDFADGAARLEGVIARERAQGVAGLHLGTMFEARARVAICSGDRTALEEYSKLTALEYRHGRSSPLGARYERLMHEARKAGVQTALAPSAFETSMLGTSATESSAQTTVESALRDANSFDARAAALARLLADASESAAAHLYLVQADGSVRWAASFPAAPPGNTELANARECLARALEDDLGSTGVLSELGGSEAANASTWTEPRQAYRTHLLTASVQGDPRHVAVVVCAQAPWRAPRNSVFAAVAAHLAQVGATEGLSLTRVASG